MSYKHKVTQWFLDEVGYCEKSKAAFLANPSVLWEKTAGAGCDNYTKYGKEMHDVYPSVMDFPAYWCDAFVDDGFYNTYGVANAKGLLCGNFDDYTKGSINLYKNKKAFFLRKETTPQEGDQIFFSKNDTFDGVHHTGYVYDVDDKRVYTVEGNTSSGNSVVPNGGEVCMKSYTLKDTRIYGYGRPNYAYYEKEDCVEELKPIPNGTCIKPLALVSRNTVIPVEGSLTVLTNLKVREQPAFDVRPEWYQIQNGYISAFKVTGWTKDDKGWRYERLNHVFEKNRILTIDNQDYVMDKDGYMVTSDRIDPVNGNIIYR